MFLSNLKELRSDMQSKEKAVTVFRFKYKQKEYFVAVCLLTDEDRKKQVADFALVRLCFMRADNIEMYLDCYANSKDITAGITQLRYFLDVEYQEDGFEWLNSFLSYLGKHIPTKVCDNHDENEKAAVLHTICRHEKRNPARIYRHHMFRNGKENGKQKHRTEYNGQLAAFRFPNLYPKFKTDTEISFAFTENPIEEKSETEILDNFERNESKRK